VRSKRVRELAIALVEVAALTVERQACVSLLLAADADRHRVHDLKLAVNAVV